MKPPEVVAGYFIVRHVEPGVRSAMPQPLKGRRASGVVAAACAAAKGSTVSASLTSITVQGACMASLTGEC